MKSLDILNIDVIKLLNSNNLLLPLIKSELIKITLNKIKLTKQETDQLKAAIVTQNKFKSETEYLEWIKKQGISETELFDKLSEQSRINKYCKKEFGHIVERKFLERKDDLEEVTYSLVRVNDSFLAKELFLRIKENETNFEEIAAEFSIGPEKNTKGLIGPISLTKSHPDLTEVLKSSKVGEVNYPFCINGVWIIARLESLKKSTLNDEMETKMSQELFNDWLNEEGKKEFDLLMKKLETITSI